MYNRIDKTMKKSVERLQIVCRNLLIFFVSSISILYHCNNPSTESNFRVVSLSPAMTEILFALNAQENLVGVTTFCDYPERAKEIYKVGDFSNPSMERIVGLKPDLVIVNLPEQMRIKKQLDKLQIKVFVSSPLSLDDMYREIAAIGKIMEKKSAAESVISTMKMTIRPSGDIDKKKRVYIELSSRPIITIGAQTFLNELLDMAGGVNIFSDLNKDYPVVSQEEIIKRNPEIIILLHPEDINERLGWKELEAVKNKKIYRDINQDHLMRPGPRLIEGFKVLREIIND